MKQVLFILFIIISSQSNALAQEKQEKDKDLAPSISNTEASRRVKKYLKHKKFWLDRFAESREIEMIQNPNEVFSALLDSLNLGNQDSLDGFRVYFAKYPEASSSGSSIDSGHNFVSGKSYGKLSLIFVPTKARYDTIRSSSIRIDTNHIDKVDSCYIFLNQTVKRINANQPSGKFLIKWVKKYQTSTLRLLEANGNGHNNKGAFRWIARQKAF